MKLLYSPGVKEFLSRLNPEQKKEIREVLEGLHLDPYRGKALQRELMGFFSLRIKRYRIVYKFFLDENIIRIYMVGPRRTIYEEFTKSLIKIG